MGTCAHSDDVGHRFRRDVSHPFRSHVGRPFRLMSARVVSSVGGLNCSFTLLTGSTHNPPHGFRCWAGHRFFVRPDRTWGCGVAPWSRMAEGHRLAARSVLEGGGMPHHNGLIGRFQKASCI